MQPNTNLEAQWQLIMTTLDEEKQCTQQIERGAARRAQRTIQSLTALYLYVFLQVNTHFNDDFPVNKSV